MLSGKVVWVTGATGGLGPAVVGSLAEAGGTVVATARNASALGDLQKPAGIPGDRWLAAPADLTDPAAAAAVVERAVHRFGRLDILVAVAGGWRGGKEVAETDADTLQWLLQTNLLTAFNAIRAALPRMIGQGWGRIITFGARAAVTGQARSAAYAASKAAVVALTQSVATEVRQHGVTANVILLSTLDTPGNRATMPAADSARWVTPENVTATIRFLCTDEAAAISGATLPVYGRA